MFTGLVEGKGKVEGATRVGRDMCLSIRPMFDMTDSSIGDSVSVNGVCLTVSGVNGACFEMFASRETIFRTTTGTLKPGDQVNLERALRLSDRLGGHIVSGHVDGIGRIGRKERVEGSWLIGIGIDNDLSRYTIEKGSVGVDGISLTINHCREGYFEVNIIPETTGSTTIIERKVGDKVNIETDLIAKYIEKLIFKERTSGKHPASTSINREMLVKYGFGD
jgi:riboflavin synthase